ncbi:MAG TPA: LapA family protein [Rhodocyclaceae bacterium]|nr:LapA family protein [Rhodocyclaceae bacterium]
MRILIWFSRIALFLLLLGFAIKNDSVVTVHLFFGDEWQVPLILVMLVMFAGGVVLGATAMVATLLSQHREIKRMRKASRYETPAPIPTPTRLRMRSDLPESF